MWPDTTFELVGWSVFAVAGLLTFGLLYKPPMEGFRALVAATCGAAGLMSASIAVYVGMAEMWPSGLMMLFIVAAPTWLMLIGRGVQGFFALALGLTWLCALSAYIAIVT